MRPSARRSDDSDVIRARLRALLAEGQARGGWVPEEDAEPDRLAALRREYLRAGLDERDVDPDPLVQVRRWLEAAAELDYPEAWQQLALLEPDPQRAAQLMRRAAHALTHRAEGKR